MHCVQLGGSSACKKRITELKGTSELSYQLKGVMVPGAAAVEAGTSTQQPSTVRVACIYYCVREMVPTPPTSTKHQQPASRERMDYGLMVQHALSPHQHALLRGN
jgi:hypothetical protein